MSGTSAKLKRKKKVDSCPNPLFIKWLTEWRDEAAERGMKTQYAYGKALSALKKYPLPLPSGKAAKILDSFGDKICAMLDKKLQEHAANQGEISALPLEAAQVHDRHSTVSSASGRRVSEECPMYACDRQCPSQQTDSGHHSPTTHRTTIKRTREYVPLYRSGPYGLILTLYRNHLRPGSKGFLKKAELLEQAQPLCEKSLTLPDPGSHYTGWSSMSTLTKKGFVYKEGNPARYVITEAGCRLAQRLEEVGQQERAPPPSADPNASMSPEAFQPKRMKSSEPEVPQYWYIDTEGRRVDAKDKAAVSIDDDGEVGFLIRCPKADLRYSSLRYKPAPDWPDTQGLSFAYLHNDDAMEICPAAAGPRGNSTLRQTHSSVNSHRMEPHLATTTTSHLSSSSFATTSSLEPGTRRVQPPSHLQQKSTGLSTTAYKNGRQDGIEQKRERPKPLFSLLPGQFDIILCVDNCETTGIGGRNDKGRKNVLLKELQKNGVNLDVRKLQVGDFLWVAREKGVAMPGVLQMPHRKEIVLDHVVERKRMDDLCSSIQDGRFKEQKFRLKQCGLRHPVYLVEEFGSADHLSLPASTLFQSVVNTQIIDGFFVKYTHDSKESAAYLTIMSRYLQSLYSGKTLKAYRKDDIDWFKDSHDLSLPEQHFITFEEFSDSSIKNREMTVTETFAKQLLQLSGLTAEKALALTEMYQTPADLLEAYRTCHLPSDQEKMLAKVKYGASQRNIGPMLSRVIYQHYCTPTALT
ncbi:crossover junction endonuclease MUS81-like [Diadema antillarum]|uniref:crossover junction endonuclease MUS81-like n=1 Tax=Diadema antillarum TaxID=105358 RepID=UPI003A889CDD